MAKYSFSVQADRLRQIGDSLTDCADQQVVWKYAAELESLGKCEVVAPNPIRISGIKDEVGLAICAGIFKKAFPLEARSAFDDLLIVLGGKGSNPSPVSTASYPKFRECPRHHLLAPTSQRGWWDESASQIRQSRNLIKQSKHLLAESSKLLSPKAKSVDHD